MRFELSCRERGTSQGNFRGDMYRNIHWHCGTVASWGPAREPHRVTEEGAASGAKRRVPSRLGARSSHARTGLSGHFLLLFCFVSGGNAF